MLHVILANICDSDFLFLSIHTDIDRISSGYTTAAQAAQLALDANVKQLVIGHFSARYEDESILLNEASAIFPQTILAKENMCIDVDGGTVYEK